MLLPVWLAACGSAGPVAEPASLPVEAAPTPAPSGLWVQDGVEHGGCVDCETPRFAIVVAEGELAAVSARAARLDGLPPGYPMLVLPQQLGWEAGDHIVLVAAMFGDELDARDFAERLDADADVRPIRWSEAGTDRFVVRVRRRAEGYDEALVRDTWGEVGDAEPRCRLAPGAAFVRSTEDVFRPADARPWIRLPCDVGSALFRVSDTDYGLIVRSTPQAVVELQDAGGVCGVRYFERRSSPGDDEPDTLETGRCFDQPARDAWGVCPGHTLAGCVDRARLLHADGTDLRRAARVASYACAWGAEEACPLRWRIDLDRGVPPGDVLAEAVGYCRVEGDEDPTGPTCVAVDRLFREIPADSLRSEVVDGRFGDVGREGCLRELPGWCDLLEASPICDLDGCG